MEMARLIVRIDVRSVYLEMRLIEEAFRLKFIETSLPGVFIIEIERREDARGYFARTWCVDELRSQGLSPDVVQINTAVNPIAGTLRGMHYQKARHAEVKIARCPRGAVFDVALDLRPESPAYLKHVGVELSGANGRALYIPEGCAHGYQVLEADSELQYMTSRAYAPMHAGGVRYNDPAFAISWPRPVTMISDQDANWPLIERVERMELQS